MFSNLNALEPIYDPIRDGRGYRAGARIARVQILVAVVLGGSAFLAFCLLRKKYPWIYVANFTRLNRNFLHSRLRRNLPRLPQLSLFGWVPVVFNIDESQVLDHAGLDAVVFLGFFKMAIAALTVCVLFSVTVITPVRYRFTGRMEFPNHNDGVAVEISSKKDRNHYHPFLWMYTVFTYVFTAVVVYFLRRQTLRIIDMRQQYLGRQRSITDRTIKVLAIPPLLRDETLLRRHVENLGVGEVDDVVVVKEWNDLSRLFRLRRRVLRQLECCWVHYLRRLGLSDMSVVAASTVQPTVRELVNMALSSPSPYPSQSQSPSPSLLDEISGHIESRHAETQTNRLPLLSDDSELRPRLRTGWFGLFGPTVDAINYYSDQLDVIDKEIRRARFRDFAASSTAFITMRSVAQAQMLAQAVLDPHVDRLTTTLAPAPHDIIWTNLCLTRRERNTRIANVMMFIGLVSVLLVFPVKYLTNFLNIKSISRVSPKLGAFLKSHRWAETLVTGILPPYVFTVFNIVMPYVYEFATKRQGYTSHGDEELSLVSKNFFYIFVNLFLVFTLFGTAIISDTAQLAYQLARSLQNLSLFYVDLIILQGIGIFPYKLLLFGNLLKYSMGNIFWCKTPRDYLNLHKPPVFNFGLQLPQPILILIITITYSVISTKIVTAGLIYFIIGYFVFKYQLLYACVHPPHNTGKVWPLVVRRVILGLFIFHATMFGTLASLQAYMCASFLAPLPVITVYLLWNFHKHYVPLSSFIALRAIENNELPFHDDPARAETAMERDETLDELRESLQSYVYPDFVCELDGPIIALDDREMLIMDAGGSMVRKPLFS